MVRTHGATREHSPGCSKSSSSKAAADESTGGVALLTRPPQAAKTACFPLGYDEDFDEPRTKLAGFFSILLGGEKLFGIGGRETTELSAVAGAVQNCHLQALQRELLVPNLFECGDTEGESSLEFRGLRQPFLL